MKRTDPVFLCAVGVMAFAIAALTVMRAWEATERQVTVRPAAGGGTGQPRDADVRKIKRLIETDGLSDHEAMYYKPADEGGVTPPAPPQGGTAQSGPPAASH